MRSGIARQRLVFMCMALAVAAVTHVAYQHANPEWIVYREAQNQYEAKNWFEAITLYEQSFSKGLHYPQAMLNVGHSYIEVRNYPKAIQWYDAYLAMKPKDVKVRRALAGALTANGEFERAEKEYQRVMQEQHDSH